MISGADEARRLVRRRCGPFSSDSNMERLDVIDEDGTGDVHEETVEGIARRERAMNGLLLFESSEQVSVLGRRRSRFPNKEVSGVPRSMASLTDDDRDKPFLELLSRESGAGFIIVGPKRFTTEVDDDEDIVVSCL